LYPQGCIDVGPIFPVAHRSGRGFDDGVDRVRVRFGQSPTCALLGLRVRTGRVHARVVQQVVERAPAQAVESNEALEKRDLLRALAFSSFGLSGAAGITGALIFVFDVPAPKPGGLSGGLHGVGYGARF